MAERIFQRTYIKEWRQKRKLSLRRLAARMEVEPGGAEIISHASINRIEKGEQPYSQEVLEALAVALTTTPASLLEVNPFKEGEVIDLVRRLPDSKRADALDYLRYLAAK